MHAAPRTHLSGLAAILLTGVLSGCATRAVAPGALLADMPSQADGATATVSVADRTLALFAEAIRDSAATPDDAGKAKMALQRGMGALDMQCQRYLDGLGSANQAADYERQATSLTGGLLSALMGITGSPAKQISGVAAGFSFAGASMDAYTNTYLFSDASKSVGHLVRESRQVFLQKTRYDENTLTFGTTVTILQAYESVCRPAQIRELVDQAIAKSTVFDKSSASEPAEPPQPPEPPTADKAKAPPGAAAATTQPPTHLQSARPLRLPVLGVR